MSKEKKQSEMPKNYNPSEWNAIGMHNKEQNIVYHENSFSLKQPDDYKVYLFGKELTNGKEWNDFLERGLELEQENKELKNRVADLEAKLVEKEQELEDWKDGTIAEKLWHLERQLAEKEKEIEELKQSKLVEDFGDAVVNFAIGNKSKLDLWHLIEQHTEKGLILEERIRELKQDKISFCIEQLEKVKEKVICGVMDISNNYWSCFVKDGSQYMTSEDLYDALEQEFIHQIEELKKENKWQGS